MGEIVPMLNAREIAANLGLTEKEVMTGWRRGEIPGKAFSRNTVRFRLAEVIREREKADAKRPLTLGEVATLLSMALPDVHTLATARILPAVKIKGTLGVRPRDMKAWEAYAESPARYWYPRGDSNARSDGFVYFLAAIGSNMVKIGESHRPDRHARISDLEQSSPLPLRLLAVKPGGAVAEAKLHLQFAIGRMRWEWFDIRTPGLRAEIASCRREFGHPRGLCLPTRFEKLLDSECRSIGVELASDEIGRG